MAVNKIVYSGQTLIDLTSDTVTADDLMEGVTAHDASGNLIVGTAKRYEETEWTNLTITNASVPSSTYQPRLKRCGSVVHIEGDVKFNSVLGSGRSVTVCANIGSENKPKYVHAWVALTSPVSGSEIGYPIRIEVSTSGAINIYNIGSNSIPTSVYMFISTTYMIGD